MGWAAISAITLGLSLAVVAASYAVILVTTQRTPRELAWTILPALLLLGLLVVTAQLAFAR